MHLEIIQHGWHSYFIGIICFQRSKISSYWIKMCLEK